MDSNQGRPSFASAPAMSSISVMLLKRPGSSAAGSAHRPGKHRELSGALGVLCKHLTGSQLRVNITSGVVTSICGAIISIVSYPAYLHYLGYELYGEWLVLATVLSLAQLGNLGIGSALAKLVAEEHGRNKLYAITEHVSTAAFTLCVVGAAILVGLTWFRVGVLRIAGIGGDRLQEMLWLVPCIGMLVIYAFVVDVVNSTLLGLGRMDLLNSAQAIAQAVGMVVTLCSLQFGLGLAGMVLGTATSSILLHALSAHSVRGLVGIRLIRIKSVSGKSLRQMLSLSSAVLGGSLISMLLSPLNKLVLARYAGLAAVPVYEMAYAGSMRVRGILEVGMRALLPEVSRMVGESTQQARARIVAINRSALKLICVCGLPVYAGLFAAATPLLKVWLGSKFDNQLPLALRIGLAGSFFSLLAVPGYYSLIGLGRVRQLLISHFIQSGANVAILCAVLVCGLRPSIPISLGSASAGMFGSAVYLTARGRVKT